MSVGVVVLNFNNWSATLACVMSLRAATQPSEHDALFIVLVDNGSATAIPERLASLVDVFIPLASNTGYGAGNNRGIKTCLSAECDSILVLNNDTETDAAAIAHLLAAREATSRGDPVLFVPEIRYSTDRRRIWYSGGAVDRWHGRASHWGVGQEYDDFVPPTEAVTFASGCAILASAETWRGLGGFEERYFLYWEDVELCVRHVDAGGRIQVVRNAIIYHDVGGGSIYRGPQRPAFYYYGTRNRLWLIRSSFQRYQRVCALISTASSASRTVGYLLVHDREGVLEKLLKIGAGLLSGLIRRPPDVADVKS